MGDDAQVIDDALAVLKEIQREYRNEPVAHLAALMSQQIRPTMAFDSALTASTPTRSGEIHGPNIFATHERRPDWRIPTLLRRRN